ncbi:ABC transporter permease [Clostridiisalibacter paucivorans]|uniref:ABC transporter permease n=1 Tax=Clostridiisalibacter paucivorans TaxID=408753 RepID=UPI00047A398F|nr:ABC transporter [Clostridiisalibacter paucivorans]
MDAVIGVMIQSLILGVMVLGVYISYSILDFPDMSADGSFALGGAIVAVVLGYGISPIVATILAILAGLLAGLLTGILHVKARISNLLSGILVMGILYSLNLRIMGKANIPLFNERHVFTIIDNPLIFSIVMIVLVKLSLDTFLNTGLGYTLKAVGDNAQMVKSLGIEIGKVKIFGLMISNGLISLSGAIMAQYQGFADASMGIGTLVLGIASIIVGQVILQGINKIKESSKILLGTIVYQITIYLAMNMGLGATDLKMITSVVIILFLASGQFRQKISLKRRSVRGWLNVKSGKSIKEIS